MVGRGSPSISVEESVDFQIAAEANSAGAMADKWKSPRLKLTNQPVLTSPSATFSPTAISVADVTISRSSQPTISGVPARDTTKLLRITEFTPPALQLIAGASTPVASVEYAISTVPPLSKIAGPVFALPPRKESRTITVPFVTTTLPLPTFS